MLWQVDYNEYYEKVFANQSENFSFLMTLILPDVEDALVFLK